MPLPWLAIATTVVALVVEHLLDKMAEAPEGRISRTQLQPIVTEAVCQALNHARAWGDVIPEYLMGTPYEVITKTKEQVTKMMVTRGEDYLVGEITDLFNEIQEILKWELEY